MDRLGEPLGLVPVRRRRLAPDEVGVGRVCEPAGDRRLDPVTDAVEALGCPLARAELSVGLVDVARQQVRRERVGPGDDQRRDVEHVRGEACGDERAHELARRHEHLAAEVTALLLRRELVLEVDGGRARLDVRLHDLEGVERPAEAGLGIGHDRRQPVRVVAPLRVRDLVGAQERVRDAPRERRAGVGGVEALVGVRAAHEVRVGGDLPAGEVDRVEPGTHHLHGLATGHRAEGRDPRPLLEQRAEPGRRRAARACARRAPSRAAASTSAVV